MESFVQLVTVIIIFAFVLAITYFTTRWVGNFQKLRYAGRNIELLEAGKLSASQYIQLVRVGDKYLILGISKEQITNLGEISKEELELSDSDTGVQISDDAFAHILEKARNIMPHK